MTKRDFNIGDKVKIKEVGFPYQEKLRYIITEVNETTLSMYEVNTPKYIYEGVPKTYMIKVS